MFISVGCDVLSARRRSVRLVTLITALLLVIPSLCLGKDKASALSPHYREWLTKDAAYIITNQEKDAFLRLTSDQARDQFIERFLEIRNPTPASPDNAYKTEHYRRITYANQYFGHVSHTEGWRTDMGRVYITLGEPAQKQKLLGLQKIAPMEIWFYSNANQALPPFFYVVFYQRDPSSEFRIYSPYGDGPEKLINSVAGPQRAEALKIISNDAGADVARVTMSLIPDEPVDMEGGQISLQSDVMLATIRNLANNPLSQEQLANRRRLLEDVTHRLILGPEYLDVLTVPLRDAAGDMNLHYVLRFKKPEDFTVGEASKGGYYYSILAAVKVYSAAGKLIFTDEKKIAREIGKDKFEEIKGKVFGFEGWLPLPPSKYKLEFQLTDLLRNAAYRREVQVAIPEVQPGELQVSNLVPFTDASMIEPGQQTLPFSGAGVQFVPMAGQELQLTQGRELKFFYQVWDAPAGNVSRAGKKLDVDYSFGRMGAKDTKTLHDEIPLDQLDPGGSVLNGKKIPTVDLAPGNYRLVMTLRDPDSQAKTYGSLSFSVLTASTASPAWDVSDEGLAERAKSGTADFQRATCYQALGDRDHALEWFQKAYAKSPNEERFRSKLVEMYFAHQEYSRVADLYVKSGIGNSTDDETIVRIAESFDKTGDTRKAVEVMESAASLKPGSGPLQLGLAEYYRKTGDLQKAAAAEQKGKQLMSAHPES